MSDLIPPADLAIPEAAPEATARLKVLVIDDAPDVRAYVRALLKKWGYDPVAAASGVEGLARMGEGDIRLVICDWMMDGMSGPEVCAAIRARDYGHYIYVLMLTGRSEDTDLVYGLDAGADDFVRKPFDAQVLRARLAVGVRIVGLEERLAEQNRRLSEHHAELKSAYRQIQRDLAAAARIQRELLPTSDAPIAPLKAAWLFLPAAQISGDSFSFFPLSRDLAGFYHLDVAGHGIPAALLSASLSRALMPAGVSGDPEVGLDPRAMIDKVNRDLCSPDGEVSNYATLAFGLVDRHTGAGRIAVAGHPRPLLLRADGRIDRLEAGGLPVGMFEAASFELQTFQLDPGDRLFMYSDGITDCFDAAGEAFDLDQLYAVLADRPGLASTELTRAIGGAVNAWLGGSELEDDISVLILERPAP